jgi:hypothetical protein
METHYKFEYDLHVSPEEAKEFLNKWASFKSPNPPSNLRFLEV